MSTLSRRDLFTRLLSQKAPQADIVLSTSSCLAWRGTMCASCKEACCEGAITFFGVMRPTISLQACTLCGDCIPVCPVGAITLNKESA